MRLLVVSDVHYRLRQLDWLLKMAGTVDAVVIAGDLLNVRSPVPVTVQEVALAAGLRALAGETELFVASGNHDLDGRDVLGEKSALWMPPLAQDGVHVDGQSTLLDEDLVTVCPWWDGPLARAALDTTLAEAATRTRRRWIWVHHAPPAGSPLAWDGRRGWGDEVLSGWIEAYRPDLVLTGHVHQAPFVRGGGWADRLGPAWVFNAGQELGPIPPHIELDLDAGTATWTAADERTSVSLTEPD